MLVDNDNIEHLANKIRKASVDVVFCDAAVEDRRYEQLGIPSNDRLDGQTLAGFYIAKEKYPNADTRGLSDYTIFVDKNIEDNHKYLFLLHEYGHHKCQVRKCACSNPDNFHPMAEAHAHKYVITYLMKKGLPVALFKYVSNISELAFRYNRTHIWDAVLLSQLTSNLLATYQPLDRLDEIEWKQIENNLDRCDIDKAMKLYKILSSKSRVTLMQKSLEMPPVVNSIRYFSLVKNFFQKDVT